MVDFAYCLCNHLAGLRGAQNIFANGTNRNSFRGVDQRKDFSDSALELFPSFRHGSCHLKRHHHLCIAETVTLNLCGLDQCITIFEEVINRWFLHSDCSSNCAHAHRTFAAMSNCGHGGVNELLPCIWFFTHRLIVQLKVINFYRLW